MRLTHGADVVEEAAGLNGSRLDAEFQLVESLLSVQFASHRLLRVLLRFRPLHALALLLPG